MSQTARDTITRAMRMLGVIIGGTTPTAVQGANGLLAMNAMMHGWKGQSVDIGHQDLGLNDNLALPDEFLNGVTALLAVELSSEFVVPVPPGVVSSAINGWSALQARYITDNPNQDMIVDTGLRRLSANRRIFYPPYCR